jgi:CPA2 family monovalent cation:H+ antiporter-2
LTVKTRELTNGLVVGIERNGKRLLNPESNIVLEKMIFYGSKQN